MLSALEFIDRLVRLMPDNGEQLLAYLRRRRFLDTKANLISIWMVHPLQTFPAEKC